MAASPAAAGLRDDGPKLVGRAPILTGLRNPRGVPQVVFIEDIADFLKANDVGVEEAIQALNTMYSKYKFMESQTQENRSRIKAKIPDIASSLEAVETLIKKQEGGESFSSHFLLSDQVYAKAEIKPDNRVCLWLGANIMLEYTYEEARELLVKNLAQAQAKLEQYVEDLAFLKDQMITTEVNIARVFNHDVKLRKKAKEAAGGGSAPLGAAATVAALK